MKTSEQNRLQLSARNRPRLRLSSIKENVSTLYAWSPIGVLALGGFAVYKFWDVIKTAFGITQTVVGGTASVVGNVVKTATDIVSADKVNGFVSALGGIIAHPWNNLTSFGKWQLADGTWVSTGSMSVVLDENGNVTNEYGSTYTLSGEAVNVTDAEIKAQNNTYNQYSGSPFLPF